MKALQLFAIYVLFLQSIYAEEQKRRDYFSPPDQDDKAFLMAAERNQMNEAMKLKFPNFRVKDVPKMMTSGADKTTKMMAAALPNFKKSKQQTDAIPTAPSGISIPRPVPTVDSPVSPVLNSFPTKRKKKMDRVPTVEPSSPTSIPTSPTSITLPSASPPPISIRTKSMSKSGSGMGMSKNPPIVALPTYPPSTSPTPDDEIPSASPVPTYFVPSPLLGKGKHSPTLGMEKRTPSSGMGKMM